MWAGGEGRAFLTKISPQLHHANDHRAARVEGQVLKTPARIEAAQIVVERMRYHAHAADNIRYAQGRSQRVGHEVRGVALPLIFFVHGELPEQQRGDRIGAIALLRLWQKGAFDLRGAQRDVADDPSRRGIGDDADAGKIVGVIVNQP